jgi:hypothetical protein
VKAIAFWHFQKIKEKGMNNETSFKNLLSSSVRPAVAVAILTGALALTIPQQLTAQQQPAQSGPVVTVANTAANPVPVAGNVNVVNTTANPVPVAGTVNVGGTAKVSIADNTATNPLQVHDVDQALRTPYAQTKRLAFNSADRAILGNFDVPAGKRLVIESFSVFGKLL